MKDAGIFLWVEQGTRWELVDLVAKTSYLRYLTLYHLLYCLARNTDKLCVSGGGREGGREREREREIKIKSMCVKRVTWRTSISANKTPIIIINCVTLPNIGDQ